jgi:HK97 gp10 family phage protein
MADVIFNEAALTELFEGAGGPVAKDLKRRTTQVERRAKQLAPVDTGRMRAAITHEVGKDGQGLFGRVGSNVDYEPHVEFGTQTQAAQPHLRPALQAAKS